MNAAEMERRNPNYVGGDINGGVQDLRQLFTRPVARPVPYSTPVDGSTSARRRRRRAAACTACAATSRRVRRCEARRRALCLTARGVAPMFDMRLMRDSGFYVRLCPLVDAGAASAAGAACALGCLMLAASGAQAATITVDIEADTVGGGRSLLAARGDHDREHRCPRRSRVPASAPPGRSAMS